MKSRSLLTFLLLLYGAFLVHLWFFYPDRSRLRPKDSQVHLIPLETTTTMLYTALYAPRHRPAFRLQLVRQLVGNFLLLLPLGLLLPFLAPPVRPAMGMLFFAFVLSLAAEYAQFYFRVGHFDVDDLLLNTTGALAGWWLYRQWRAIGG